MERIAESVGSTVCGSPCHPLLDRAFSCGRRRFDSITAVAHGSATRPRTYENLLPLPNQWEVGWGSSECSIFIVALILRPRCVVPEPRGYRLYQPQSQYENTF